MSEILGSSLAGLICAGTVAHAAHSATFEVDTEKGTYSFESDVLSLTDIRLEVGNIPLVPRFWDVLKDAKLQPGSTDTRATYVVHEWFWELTIDFEIVRESWLQVSFSAKNLTAAPRTLDSIHLAKLKFNNAFEADVDPDQLHFFYDTFFIWGKAGQKRVKGGHLGSMSYGVLYQPGRPALVVGFRPPQLWSDRVRVNGHAGELTADVWQRTPYIIDPGQTAVFDPLLIGTAESLTAGLQSLGTFYTPRTRASETAANAGWNSWECFRKEITRENVMKAADTIIALPEIKEDVKYLVLDNGWQIKHSLGGVTRGDWQMDEKYFGTIEDWVKDCVAKGFVPGVWITSCQFDRNTFAKHDFILSREEGKADTVVIDPSDPKLREYLYGQLRALREAGIRYFKTDFMVNMDTQVQHHIDQYYYSKEPTNTVLREFYKGIREAIGEDSFWLGCGTTTASAAGLVDASRIGTDITANWDVTKEIYGQMSAKFWYHGNLWLNDPDFLIVMGDKQLKPEAKGRKNYQLGEKGKPRAYEGYTPEKAKTWATMIVISGGVVIWSDNPPDINESGLKIVETALEHGGGNSGVPLDLETEQYPRKWVRRERDRVYLAAINVEDKPITVFIDSSEVPELKIAKSASDIFSGERHPVQNGKLELAVPPFSSHCMLVE